TARQRAQAIKTQVQALIGDLDKTRLWTFQTDYARLADAFADGEDAGLLAEALTTLRAQGSDKLLDVIADLARREAERAIIPLDLVQLMEQESAQLELDLNELDPVVLVGENLLDQVRHQTPTWRLTTNARPRVMVLQITPNGENVFDHPGLETARYGERTDRLGFLEAQMDTALDELQVIHDTVDLFKQARLKREYFVLESVIKAWGDGKPAQPGAVGHDLIAPRGQALEPGVAVQIGGDGDGHSAHQDHSITAEE
ncbi:MAG: hypothetical protein HZC40_16795, partial [Chloroflexi bacterium]|nr:hypothetical protein [Chloroflexota bacterium]